MNKEIRDKYYRCLRVWIFSQSKDKKSFGLILVDREVEGWVGKLDNKVYDNLVF